ncbi:MAG: tRNA 2-thiouridine(34) synthase MnmA [Spirochaetaceae bacterium]|jgi:tRNA-specific 2-thiouridylase|nr:tRNA 2-thiouridine(34) synthase MnmA [Spirochaetaceae bacterium]
MNKRCLIAMSGGVDSATAAILMQDAGYDCIGATMKLIANGGGKCCSLQDINDARDAAWKLGIPHYVLNYTQDFTRHVIEPFIENYEKGETPNPCIECNRHLKFSLLLRRALELEAETLVTGHYAQIEKSGGRWLLKKGIDPEKDQSYVLYMMTQEELSHTVFPLGKFTKAQARNIAAARGLANAQKKESQDICFVDNGDYAAFIESYTGKRSPEGNITDTEGNVLGRHRGLIRYTLGQRRGLGVACNKPVYAAAKNQADNILVVGDESFLYSKSLATCKINLVACENLFQPRRLGIKTRYLQKESYALVEQTGPDTIRVEFEEPQRAITPGQAAVFYDGDVVVGGGTISQENDC